MKLFFPIIGLLLTLTACNLGTELASSVSGGVPQDFDETGRVDRVIDGDTIDVVIDGETLRVRYVGVNTPERDEPCYQDATDANANLVAGRTVGLVRDTSETDQYGRLLRYVYADGVFVNEELVRGGYAEAVKYGRDDRYWNTFLDLEQIAADARWGCHATGIFDDGNDVR